jgi:hypothetical protein
MRVRNVLLRPSLLLAVGLTLLLLVATGCGLAPTTTPRASDRWSNGKLVGTAILNNQVALQVDEVGHSFMVWVGLEHELHFAHVNERAEVIVQQLLDLRTDSPLKPQLRMDPTGQMHLTWLDKRERGLQLFYARLSTGGAVIQDATALSPPEWRAAHSSMVLDPVGQTVQVFWSDNVYSRPGCYHAALDWSGEVVVPAEMLIQDGILPVAQVDRQGFVHMAWRVESEAERPTFHYAVYDPQRRALGSDIVASEPLVQMGLLGGPTAGATFDGPWLGLDERSVYLVWVLEVRERGDVKDFSFYQAFPQPTLSPRDVGDTFDYPLPEVTGGAVYVAFPGADPSMTGHPWFLEGHPARQVLACFTQVSGPGGSEMLQIAAIDVGPGQITGHDIINASRGASLQPNVAVDPSGNLHLAWIDTAGFSRYHVIYASTSPQAREALNRVTAYDVVDKILTGVMYVLSSLFFVPLVLVWMLIPIGWLLAFALITRESEISDPRGRRALVIALILHLGAQLFLFPDLLARFPLGSLLSPSLAFLVGRWVFPLFLAVLSAGVAWVTLKRGRGQSIFAPYLVFAAVDSFFILVIYVALPLVG